MCPREPRVPKKRSAGAVVVGRSFVSVPPSLEFEIEAIKLFGKA